MVNIPLATDSTVSQGKWKMFKMPHIANFDYLNAKATKLYSWLDQIAFTTHQTVADGASALSRRTDNPLGFCVAHNAFLL